MYSPEAVRAVSDILTSGLTRYDSEHAREGKALEIEWARSVGLPHAVAACDAGVAMAAVVQALGGGVVSARERWRGAVLATGSVFKDDTRYSDDVTVTGVVVTQPHAGIDDIVRWCMRRGAWLVEDCSGAPLGSCGRQSHVAVWDVAEQCGGGGGMITCLDDGLAATLAVAVPRMTEMQAVLGRYWLRERV